MPDESTVSVRYLVDDVATDVDFYTSHLGFRVLTSFPPAFADVRATPIEPTPAKPNGVGPRGP